MFRWGLSDFRQALLQRIETGLFWLGGPTAGQPFERIGERSAFEA
jgi:hypothetical protein